MSAQMFAQIKALEARIAALEKQRDAMLARMDVLEGRKPELKSSTLTLKRDH
jgi:hypothetical protein